MNSISRLSILKGPKRPLPDVKYLSRLFEDNAAKCPDTVAVIYRDVSNDVVRQMTYAELEKGANRMARAILSRVDPSPNNDGDFVIAVCLPPTDLQLLVLLAIWKCGATQMPLEKHTPSGKLQHILNETEPVLIITEEEDSERYAAYDGYKITSLRRLTAEATKMSPSLIRDNEMLSSTVQPVAVIFYTSGSTGLPKGVRLTQRMLLNRLSWQWQEFPYSSTETVCVVRTTQSFGDIIQEIWIPLVNTVPKTILILPKNVIVDHQKLIPLLEEYKVERILVLPSLLRSILMYLSFSKQKQLTNIRTWICTSEPLPVSLVRQFFNYFSTGSYKLCNMYGTTEVLDVTFHVITNKDCVCMDDNIPIGRPIANTNIYLLDKDLRPVLIGEIGQICVSGLNMSDGYVNGREPERFIKNPFSADPDHNPMNMTGDYGRIVNGQILYEGRNDSQVKVRGHRVDLAEIDVALNKIKGINNSVVLCYRPGELDQMVIAYVTQHEDSNLTEDEIEERLQSLLAPYAIPKVFIIDKIPLMNNAKVDRQGLTKRYAEINEGKSKIENVEIDYSGIPEGKLHAAQCLLRTVGSILAGSVRGKISLQSNFYSLGGHSLNSVYTVTKLRDQGYIIGITDFINAETLLDVVNKMTREDIGGDYIKSVMTNSERHYVSEKAVEAHKSDFIRIIVDSFYLKGELKKWLDNPPQREDYEDAITKAWPDVVGKELSFVTRCSKTGEVIGASLNFDVHDQPAVFEHNKNFGIICEYLKYVQDPIIKNKLPQGKGQVMVASLAGTEKSLTTSENVSVMYFMMDEIMKLCKSEGFVGMFACNASPLTQQLAADILNHKVLCNYQINKYVASDGSKPFKRASDADRVMCTYGEV